MSGRIEQQRDHALASQSFCSVHPRHQELIGGGHDTEAEQAARGQNQLNVRCNCWASS